MPLTVDVRALTAQEWPTVWPLMTQLRKLDLDTFLQRLRVQSLNGYQLIGAFADGGAVALMGIRPVHTLARGLHLHVDDLIVAEHCRGQGAGQALIAYAEALARAQGIEAIFLDARPDAIPFYEKLQFKPHLSPSMRKGL